VVSEWCQEGHHRGKLVLAVIAPSRVSHSVSRTSVFSR
jgi:hypothetical protein